MIKTSAIINIIYITRGGSTLIKRRTLFFLGLMMTNLVVKKDGNTLSKNNRNKLNLPSFINTFEVVSSIDGRVRFVSPILRNNINIGNMLIEQLKTIDVIKRAEINVVRGSILVEYDNSSVDGETIEGVLMKLLNLDRAIGNRTSTIRKKSKNLIEAVNNGIYDYSKGWLDIKTIALLYFISSAFYDLRVRGRRASQDYLTLLWWSSSLF